MFLLLMSSGILVSTPAFMIIITTIILDIPKTRVPIPHLFIRLLFPHPVHLDKKAPAKTKSL